MKVKELITALQEMDPQMDVVCQRYSDFQSQEIPTVIEVIDTGSGKPDYSRWIRYYPNQWKDQIPPAIAKVCCFEGN